jgi:hypothetical protein
MSASISTACRVGWRGAAALGLACTLAVLANAEQQQAPDDLNRPPATDNDGGWIRGRQVKRVASKAAIEPGDAAGGLAGGAGSAVQFFSGFEPPCSTTLNGNGYVGGGGSGDPQNCDWHASTGAQPGYQEPHIDDIAPWTGAQHLRFQYDPNQPSGSSDQTSQPGQRNWAFTDPITPTPVPDVQHLSMWVKVNGAALIDNALIIQPQASSQGLLTTVFRFDEGGNIWVGDDDEGCGTGFFVTNTSVPWIPNQYVKCEICIDVPNDRIRYFYNDQFIYSTGAGEGGLGGGDAGCGVFAGSAFELVLIRYEGNNPGNPSVDVDDVTVEQDNCPEVPGACCDWDGQGGCQVMFESECAATGTGVYVGVTTDCSDPNLCPAVLGCAGAIGDCFTPHPGPGCEDPACCVAVCLAEPLCCSFGWDFAVDLCPSIALEICSIFLCEQPDTNCQAISTENASTSTIDSWDVADNFAVTETTDINAVCWYGVYGAVEPLSDDFTVTYYLCTDGVPGAQIAQYNQTGAPPLLIVQPRSDTNRETDAGSQIWEYQATHPNVTVDPGQMYFIEIVNNLTGEGEVWRWSWSDDSAGTGDSSSYQRPSGGTYARYYRVGHDEAFCLNVPLADMTGLCDLPPLQACHMDIPPVDFEENEPCGSDPDLNLGCSVTPSETIQTVPDISTDPAAPTTVHGEADNRGGSRDVDWYTTLAPAGVDQNLDGTVYMCLSAIAELPIGTTVRVGISCSDSTSFSLATVGYECASQLSVGYAVDDQSQQFIAVRTRDGVEIFDGYPCMDCPWDCQTEPDDIVNIPDFLAMLATWGQVDTLCDFDSGGVGSTDFLAFLANFGVCEGGPFNPDLFGNDYILEISFTDLFEDCFP